MIGSGVEWSGPVSPAKLVTECAFALACADASKVHNPLHLRACVFCTTAVIEGSWTAATPIA